MEARDALTDFAGAARPRARPLPEPADAAAIVAALAMACAVCGTAIIGADSYLPSPPSGWAIVAFGYAVAVTLWLSTDRRSGRFVSATRAVPLIVGLVHLAPTTLMVVALVVPLVLHAWLRHDQPRRVVTDSALWSLETLVALVVFRMNVDGGLDTVETWAVLALSTGLAVVVRSAVEWGIESLSGSQDRSVGSIEVGTRIADTSALALGIAVGVGGVGLALLAPWGAVVGMIATAALAAGEFLEARAQRRLVEANEFADAQESVVAGIASGNVLSAAARAVRDLMQADVAVVGHSDGVAAIADSDGVVESTARSVAAAVLRCKAGEVSLLAGPQDLNELRSVTDLGDASLFVLCATFSDNGADVFVLAARKVSDGHSFAVSARRLLHRIAPMIAGSVDSSDRLARYQRQARFDELTGLPSRVSIEASIEQSMAEVRPMDRAMAVMLVDLNGFKAVNDTLGHQTGDVVLAEIGRRIGTVAPSVDAVGRLGGDEFVVVISADDRDGLMSKTAAVAAELAEVVGEQIVHGDLVLDIGISIGIALFPDHGDNPGEMLRAADVAMYAAKSRGIPVLAYEGRLDRHRSRRLGLATDLRAALAADQLDVFFQPKVAFLDGELVGAEALIRWTHPTLHAVPAGEIIDVADHAGLLRDITDFVLERAARQIVALREVGCDVPIAVNLTERDIADPDLPERYCRALAGHGLEPGVITLEVTETALLTREVESLGVLPRMSEMGVTLAIDDFGTGFSSLSHLRRFPVDEIKIDMSFVERMVIRPNDAVIVRSIVELGHSLGLRVVAEGVETNEAWNLLEEFGVDVAQGNHVMKAIDPDSFLLWAPFWDRHRTARGFLAQGAARPPRQAVGSGTGVTELRFEA